MPEPQNRPIQAEDKPPAVNQPSATIIAGANVDPSRSHGAGPTREAKKGRVMTASCQQALLEIQSPGMTDSPAAWSNRT